MERFAERGNELSGVRQPRSFESSMITRHSDMDFDDVYGGPPRRYSMQEVKMKYSFCESIEESSEDNNEGTSTTFEAWSGLIEKPVFGEESVNRRRHVNVDFFDDIFKGGENLGSPRKSDYHGSNPGSRISSPARPLSPKAEPFSTSPPQFSLLPELTKASDSPGLTSDHGITNKNEDVKSDVSSSPVLSKGAFSKFLNRAMRGKHDSRGDQYRQSPLSREASVGNLESLIDGSQFHFSIHRWVQAEVPLIVPLRERKTAQVEEKKDHRASRSTQPESPTVEIKKDDERSNQDKLELREVAKEAKLDISDSKIDNVVEHHAVDSQSTLNYYLPEETQRSTNVDRPNNVKRAPRIQHPEQEIKPLGALFSEKVDEQEAQRKERAERAPEGKKGAKSANSSNEEKKIDARKKSSKKNVVSKSSAPDSPNTSGDISHKSGVKGKVRDFVKIFSQETAERSKGSFNNQSQSCRWSPSENYGMDDEMKVDISETETMTNAFSRTDESPLNGEVKKPSSPQNIRQSGSRDTEQKEASSFTESFNVTDATSESYYRESFSVEELSIDQEKDLQPSGDPDYIKVSDAKIKQWSQGRKGNIRSLLSTLQLVLWPESGWRPVPLMNIIDGSGVKRAYQRALLCLHPDKLQQKGASPDQKYIAEKVFDILQEAWDHFNTLGDT